LNKEGSVESALLGFCRNLPHGPDKLLRTAYGVRNFRSNEMDRLFIKTEMYLKSKTATNASMPNSNSHHKTLGPRSRSSDVLPSSQSQINIQMVSHTLTIQEVNYYLIQFCKIKLCNSLLLGVWLRLNGLWEGLVLIYE